ncbi:phosphate ABC transporter substrate-binding protein [Paenibacillus daejeonensis]|uniref:phosphate ABC transporter substrate-binding protein n=1 Tax=Paenibacillus daejeonensis TaxID=135193 RepID=UPI000380D4AC|nr:phosphate ABC transporter substrate-binding protein [Paenibacillus daejeonensis]
MKKSLLLVMTLVLSITLAACGGNNTTNNGTNNGTPNNSQGSTNTGGNNTPETEPPAAELEGQILAVGSSAMAPLVEEAANKFMDENGKVTVLVQAGGSGTGLTQVSEGQSDIGNSDIFAEEKFVDDEAPKAAELVDHQIAVVAMAAVVNPEVGIDNLTQAQLLQIFKGEVTNWSEVGGIDQEIVIVNRPSSSGTRKTFESYALGEASPDLPGQIQEESSGNVRKLIGETPGAIGYLALSYLDDSITALSYDGIEPTEENVTNGEYPIWAYQHMYTKGEPSELVQAFLDFMLSDEVQTNDVVELGYIPASAMTIVRDVEGNVTQK